MELDLKVRPHFAAAWRAPLSLAVAVMATVNAHAALPTFTCEPLEDHADRPTAFSFDINSRGQMTGWAAFDPGKEPGGVMWKRDGRVVPMAKAHPGRYLTRGINDAGQVVGDNIAVEPNKAFIWNAGERKGLESLVGAAGLSRASGINSSQVVVGESAWEAGSSKIHAVLWKDRRPVDLGVLPGDEQSSALGVNDDGLIVGVSLPKSGMPPERAVQWGPNGIVQLAALPGHARSAAMKVNRLGMVIGIAFLDSTSFTRPVAWVDGVPHDLGVLPGRIEGRPSGVNAAGKVVGYSMDADGRATATYWPGVGHTPVDLNSLIVGGGCIADGVVLTLNHATGINDKGIVAAYGQREDLGTTYAYRLVPKKP